MKQARVTIERVSGAALVVQGARPGGLVVDGSLGALAADERALAAANRAVGNAWHAPAIELLLGPLTMTVAGLGPGDVAVVGAPLTSVRAGALRVGPCAPGLRGVLAVRGGLLLPPGAAVVAGATIDVGPSGSTHASRPLVHDSGPGDMLRVVVGAEVGRCDDGVASLTRRAWRVSPTSSRQGVRLEPDGGAGGIVARGAGLVTAPVWPGDVQVPPSGQPIALGAASTSTGGYPRVARVIDVDVWRLGQLRPGAVVRFVEVALDEACALRRAWHLERDGG